MPAMSIHDDNRRAELVKARDHVTDQLVALELTRSRYDIDAMRKRNALTAEAIRIEMEIGRLGYIIADA